MARRRWLSFAGVLIWGCLGGQTGEDGGSAGAGAVCRASEVEIGLDQRLPAGYTARELIEVLDGLTPRAYLLPAGTTAGDRSLEPDDALAMTEVALAFEPADGERVTLFEGAGCSYRGFTVHGTLTATTLDGEATISVRGGLAGPPEDAFFWQGNVMRPPGPPSPALYGEYVLCNPDVHPMTVWMSAGEVMGNLCTARGLVRFPTACGGFAQAPIDEPVAAGLPLPSAVIERLRGARLEVAWNDAERSPLELTITPAELTCYEEVDYDYEDDEPRVTSTTAVDVEVTIEGDSIAFEQQTSLVGSRGLFRDLEEPVLRLTACADLQGMAVEAIDRRFGSELRRARACLSVAVSADERLEVALELTGDSADGEELQERVSVLEVER